MNTTQKERVVFYVDGYNLYHSIAEFGKNYLKWVDLKKLCNRFVHQPTQEITDIYYVTASPTHTPQHVIDKHSALMIAYKKVLGIRVLYGKFKPRSRECKKCGYKWNGHEEKESDVNLAVEIVRGAYDNLFDRALILSQDSDIAPAAKLAIHVINNSTNKNRSIRLLTPPLKIHSNELSRILTTRPAKIKEQHLATSLLDAEYYDEKGALIVKRPSDYDPPI